MFLPKSIRSLRFLFPLPLVWLACTDGESLNPLPIDGGTTTSATGGAGGSGTTASSGSGGIGGTGGGTSASSTGSGGSGGAGGAMSSSGGGGAGGATSSSASSGSGGGLGGTRVRVAAANLTSGNGQSYDPGEGIRILQGVHADVVLMQEMNYGTNTTAELRELVDAACGTECAYARGSGQIPNGVLSRHPILDSGTWTDPKVQNRDFVWARLDVPGPVDLWAVSVHLLTSSPSDRDAEAAALIAAVQAKVPSGDYLVVGGDFNTDVRDEPVITTLDALLSTAAPYPMDGNGNGNTSRPRTRPYDWVLPSAALRLREAPVTIGAAHFDTGLVVDTRVYLPIADLSPALTNDSGATGMQHMAVVRDFLLE